MDILAKISELHGMWWEGVWTELAWGEHGNEPLEFALTIGELWDRFNMAARGAGLDPAVLAAEFEARGDPKATTDDDRLAIAEKALCCS